jgi:hypothetical protein
MAREQEAAQQRGWIRPHTELHEAVKLSASRFEDKAVR